MNRRQVLSVFCGVTAWPILARAQSGSMPVVGFLSSAISADQTNLAAACVQGLREMDFLEGRNIAIEYRWAEGQYENLPALAANLVARGVSVIIAAGGSDPAKAAKAATSTIPIVFVSAADPVRTGLVATLSRPEANVTGISMVGATLEAKRLELLHQLVSRASVMGILVNPLYPAVKRQIQDISDAAARLGLRTVLRQVSTKAEIDVAFADFVGEKAGVVLICNDPFLGSSRTQLVELALRHSLPAMSFRREFASVGGLISYGADFDDGYRNAGIYAGRILKGAKTTDLPVLQPTKFELIVNLKAARTLDLDVPAIILAQADEVIE